MLLWTGIVAIVVGVVFGLTQLAARQITSTD
jgi:hypothetical protein